jgi:HEAT repeat protein
LLLLIARFAVFLEDLYERRKGIALLLFAVTLVLPSRSLYNGFLLHSLHTDPNARAHEYASSKNATKRYFSLVHCSMQLPYEKIALLSRDPNPVVRHYAFIAMRYQRDPVLFSALKEGVSDPEQIVRTKVYQALGDIGDEDALRLLDRAIEQDPSWYARDYAYKAKGDVERIYRIVEKM